MSDLASRVRAVDLHAYLTATGWVLRHTLPSRISIFENGPERHQALVPDDRSLADYGARVWEVVEAIARVEQRDAREVLTELLHPPADVLRFRVVEEATEGGLLPLPMAVDFVDGCHRALLSAACAVGNPRPFYARLGTTDAEAFIAGCKLGTERGSFVATVLCPLDAGATTLSALMAQLTLPSVSLDLRPTYARRVVTLVMSSVQRLVAAIEANDAAGLVRQVQEATGGDLGVSANLCEAIMQMQPRGSPDGILDIEVRGSRMLAWPAETPQRVRIERQMFPSIAAIASALRPQDPDVISDTFVGQVESLHGKPDEEKIVGGDIVLRFFGRDGNVLRARVLLNPADYGAACDAHKVAHTVAVKGQLRRTPRGGRIESPESFRDVSLDSARAPRDRTT